MMSEDSNTNTKPKIGGSSPPVMGRREGGREPTIVVGGWADKVADVLEDEVAG